MFGSTGGGGAFGGGGNAFGSAFGGGGNSGGSAFGGGNTGGSAFGSTGNAFGGGGAGAGNQNSAFGAGGFGAGGGVGNNQNQAQGGMRLGQILNQNGDYEVPRDQNAAQDSFSAIEFTPSPGNLLIAGSWDGKVRCYDIQDNGNQLNGLFKASVQHQGPVLDVSFKHDGSGCFSGGCDNMVKMWNFGQPTPQDVGKHDAPVKCVGWIPDKNLLASASWDRTLRYWDLRAPNPVLQVQLPGRCDCMDVRFPYLVVGTGGREDERQVAIYNLNNPAQPERVMNQTQSNTGGANNPLAKPLKKQFLCLRSFHDNAGFTIAGIEGRCAIKNFNQQQISKDFAFKCHRDKNRRLIYAVNTIAFHRQFGSFATCGSDGMYNFWDKEEKQRLKASKPITMQNGEPLPIVSCSFNSSGNLFAYAVSYDWSKGATGNNPNEILASIFVHRNSDDEVKPKPKGGNLYRR